MNRQESKKQTLRNLLTIIIIVLIHYNSYAQDERKVLRVSDDIELIKLTDNAYLHISYYDLPGNGRVSANGLIYINGSEAFLFDTQWTNLQTKELLYYLRDSMRLTIKGFVPNHCHDDCMGGLRYLQSQNIESWANRLTIDIATANNLPVPMHGFRSKLQLHLGEKPIWCYYPGPAHSLDNIVVWIPAEKILFAGCMVKNLDATNLGNTRDGDLNAYPQTIKKLLRKYPDAKIVIPGHGQPGGIELVKHTLELAKK